MKLKVDVNQLMDMRKALRQAAPRSLINSTMMHTGIDWLTCVVIGDGVYAQYTIPDIHIEASGHCVVHNSVFDPLDGFVGTVDMELVGKRLHVSGNMQVELATEEIKFDIFTMPNENTQPDTWYLLPENAKRVLYPIDDDTAKRMGKDTVWFYKDTVFTAEWQGFRFSWVNAPETLSETPIAAQHYLMNRVMQDGGQIGFTDHHVWIRRENFLAAAPTVNAQMNTVYPLIMGYEGRMKELAYFELDRDEFLRYVTTLTYLSTSQENLSGTLWIALSDGKLSMKPTGNELGTGDVELDVEDSDGEFDMGLGATWFKESLNNCDPGMVRLSVVQFVKEDGTEPPQAFFLTDGKSKHLIVARVA